MGMTLKTTAAAGALLITFLTAAAPALQGQQRPRITESVDSRRTVLLPGTTHARIRQAQDRGRVAADLVMDRAILTLKSSPEQEAELGALLAAQQESSRSEEHTSELQSQSNLVCRLLLEKKKNKTKLYGVSTLQAL